MTPELPATMRMVLRCLYVVPQRAPDGQGPGGSQRCPPSDVLASLSSLLHALHSHLCALKSPPKSTTKTQMPVLGLVRGTHSKARVLLPSPSPRALSALKSKRQDMSQDTACLLYKTEGMPLPSD